VWTSRVKSLLAKAGVGVYRLRNRYVQDGLSTVHPAQFQNDPAFRAAYNRGVQASQGVDPQFEWRLHTALWAAHTALRVPGDFVECGVNAGFMSSAIMQRLNWNAVARRFYLIDTFAGPVLSQFSPKEVREKRLQIAEDAFQAGAYVTDLERIRANFAEWPNALPVQGAVPDILPSLGIETVAFLHIDMNCALPERAALEFFWDRLSPGAIVLLDDYGYRGHECQREAIDEAARKKNVQVLSLPTGQGIIIK
jgi:Macrocin-O-methyltransferase (TylF)